MQNFFLKGVFNLFELTYYFLHTIFTKEFNLYENLKFIQF